VNFNFNVRMNHETHLSTQQAPPQKNHRISSADENKLRKKNYQSPQKTRPQEASRLARPTARSEAPAMCEKSGLTFPKNRRLRRRSEFTRLMKHGERLVGRYFCLDYRPAKMARLGISASTRFGSSPERNRFKRLIREAFRNSCPSLPPYDMNVIPRQSAKGAVFYQIFEEWKRLLKCN